MRSTIPMPKGYQDTIPLVTDEDRERIKNAFSKEKLKSNSWWVPLGTKAIWVGGP